MKDNSFYIKTIEYFMNQLSQFINNHWQLCLLFAVVLLLTLVNEFISNKKKAKELNPQSAVDMMNNQDVVIIDLRDKDAFKSGHIIDAINASAADFDQPKMDKYKEKDILLVCARGQQAPVVAAKIKAQGFKPLVLSGGIVSWQNANLPLVKTKG